MHISVSRDLLTEILKPCVAAASRKVPNAAWSQQVLLSVNDDGNLLITGTDTALYIRGEVTGAQITGGEPRAVVLNAKALYELVRGMTAPTVEITVPPDHRCVIQGGEARYTLAGIGDRNFPPMPFAKKSADQPWVAFELDAEAFRGAVGLTGFAVGSDETNIYSSLILRAGFERLSFQGSENSYHWAVLHHPAEGIEIANEGVPCFAIPYASVREALNVLGEDPVSFVGTPHQVTLETGRFVITSVLKYGVPEDMHAKFVAKLIGRTTQTVTLTVERAKDVLSRLKVIAALSNAEQPYVALSASEGFLHVTANAGEAGDGAERIPAEIRVKDGEDPVVGPHRIKLRYLMGVLSAVEGAITLHFGPRLREKQPAPVMLTLDGMPSYWYAVQALMEID
jgi:DNA polymerase III sliding clamp (beta) subunit (PCNA family)